MEAATEAGALFYFSFLDLCSHEFFRMNTQIYHILCYLVKWVFRVIYGEF